MKAPPFILAATLIALPLRAQDSPSGPVHLPSPPTPNMPVLQLAQPPSSTLNSPGSIVVPSQPASSVMGAPGSLNQPAPTALSTADLAEDIRDIHGPISIPYQWLWLAYLAGVLAVIAALYAGWRAYRRHAKERAKLPHELALERLEAARVLMTENQVREYAFEVSEIVRVYIEKRFGERAARRTTEEFLSDLLKQTGTPLAEYCDSLEDFLHHCDLPKFARWQLSVREMEAMQESARSFIVHTKPQPKHVVSAKAQAQPELIPAK
jgi:Domain of unknown function (DUF4381)